MQSSPRVPLLTLSFGNFVIGTGTMMIAGLLNLIAADLRVSVVAVGQLIAGYGIAVCFGAPLLAGLTSHIDRRKLLVAALVLFAAAHLCAALAPGYTTLLVLRVLTGFGAAIFTPQAAATAGLLVAPTERGRAIALVFLGFSIASVLGNPISIFLGAGFGWRTSLAIVGAVAVVCAISLRRQIPPGLFVQRIDAAAWRQVARNAALLLTLAVTVLQAAGQFVLVAYLAVIFGEHIGATSTAVGLLFAWFGVCGVTGNIVGGRLIDRVGAWRVVSVSMTLMLIGLLLWPLTRASVPFMVLALGIWGFGSFVTVSAQQVRLVTLAPALASASVALNSSGFYLGQAVGAMIGGLVLASLGMAWMSWFGALLLVLALAASYGAERAGARGQAAQNVR